MSDLEKVKQDGLVLRYIAANTLCVRSLFDPELNEYIKKIEKENANITS